MQPFDKHMPTQILLFDYQMPQSLHDFDYHTTTPRVKRDRQQSKNPLYNPFIWVYNLSRIEQNYL